MAVLCCDTTLLINPTTIVPTISPRQAGFSNQLSPFASDDLCELSDEDEDVYMDDESSDDEEVRRVPILDSISTGGAQRDPAQRLPALPPKQSTITLEDYEDVRVKSRPNYREEESGDELASAQEESDDESASEQDDENIDEDEEYEYEEPASSRPPFKRRVATDHVRQVKDKKKANSKKSNAKKTKARKPKVEKDKDDAKEDEEQKEIKNSLPIDLTLHLPPKQEDFTNALRKDGQMTDYQCSVIVYGFISNISPQKHFKALINLELATHIREALERNPHDPYYPPTFRKWSYEQFKLADDPKGDQMDGMNGKYLIHQHRRVAIVEQFYDLLTAAHTATRHGGRDKCMAVIRDKYSYSYLPKDLVQRYALACPKCYPERSAAAFSYLNQRMARDKSIPIPSQNRIDYAASAQWQAQQSNNTRSIKPRPTPLPLPARVPFGRRGSDESLVSIPPTPMAVDDSTAGLSSVSPVSACLDIPSGNRSALMTPLDSPALLNSSIQPTANRPSIESMLDPSDSDESATELDHQRLNANSAASKSAAYKTIPAGLAPRPLDPPGLAKRTTTRFKSCLTPLLAKALVPDNK